MARGRSGVTLPELLLAMTLSGLVMAIIYPIMAGTTRAILRAEADTQTQQKAVLLVEKFFSDFAFSSRASLTILEQLPAAAFLSRESMRVNGLPPLSAGTDFFPSSGNSYPIVWRKFVALHYFPASGVLERMEFPYPGGSQLASLGPDQLNRLLSDARYTPGARVVVSGISSFKMKPVGDNSLLLELTSKESHDVERSTLVKVILSMRN
jgi:prepilin-type N-terminal cleavage/methylation domain-containing protein